MAPGVGEWNVLAIFRERGFDSARRFLGEFGPVYRTAYLNVLAMTVDEASSILDRLRKKLDAKPEAARALVRVAPAQVTINFQTPEDFRSKVEAAARPFVDALSGKSFHVRMHRRGFKGRLSSAEEEPRLADRLLEALAARGEGAKVSFDDPDVILVVDTMDGRAGLSLWTRDQMRAHPLLRPGR